MLRHALTVAALLALAPSSSDACTLCVGLPAKSDADYLIESDCVILAREDPNQPFSFAPVEVLKGDFDGREIDLLVDSLTRRRLSADNDRKVFLVQTKKNGAWRSLGIASEAFEAVCRRVLMSAPAWERVSERETRFEFFAQLFGHEDPQIFRLAYLEVSRAPYQTIRRLGRVTPRARFAAMLEKREFIEWRPLAILLLGQSRRPEDIQYLRDSLESAQRLGLTTTLAALASAAIEIDGPAAVAYLEENYFRSGTRTCEELREVIIALSLQGTEGTRTLRNRIIAAYAVLLENRPNMSPLVARDMAAWNRTDLADQLRRIEASRTRKDNTRLPVASVAGASGQ